MKSYLVILALGGAILLVASIAIGIMISIGNGHPSWILIGVFAMDSIILVWLGARAFGWKKRASPGTHDSTQS